MLNIYLISMETKEYLDNYEDGLMQYLLRMLTSMGHQEGQLLETPDINDTWAKVYQSYLADAVGEIANYPTVALGWAMYLGMAVAHYWDDDWSIYGNVPNLYEYIRDKRGFDYLDEVVSGDILMLKGDECKQKQSVVLACAELTLSHIRAEHIEPQSPRAYYVFARSVSVLFRLGASIELKSLGYKFEQQAL